MGNATRTLLAKGLTMGLLALGLPGAGAPARAATIEVGPDGDLCEALRQVEPGDEVVLQPGDYPAGCAVRRGGLPQAPVVIRPSDPANPPRLTQSGLVNLLEIRASDVVIRGLTFGPTVHDADGIRIFGGERITVEQCRFTQLGGIAVVANHSSVRTLTVKGNVISQSTSTGMYFGCHDGVGCVITDLLVEGNHIHGVDAPDPEIGYGIEVKLNSTAVIRNNVISDTKGPGIMIYGARELTAPSIVERNFVRGSRTSSGIVVGGGPGLVRNNISGWNAEGGIGLENYGRRGLLRAISVLNNTVYGNREGGVTVPASGPLEATLQANAGHGRADAPAFPSARPGLRLIGNLDCTGLSCFVDPEGLDFSPAKGSPLRRAGVGASAGVPADDFFGTPRSGTPVIGAVQHAGPRIELESVRQ